jgi:hypothetical protein
MNQTRLRWPLAAAVLALVVGCDDAVAPAGTPSTVSVHAYVDADGSGTMSAGDVMLPGVEVTLEPTGGGAALQGTTNAEGVAVFEVPPGTYRVSTTGAAPQGAVLATATSPIIAAPYQGA